MKSLRIIPKGFILLFLVIAYILTSLFWGACSRNLVRRRFYNTRTVSFFCRLALKVLNFQVHVHNHPGLEKSYLVVGNHLGFLDILVLSSVHPSLFITSVEMRHSPGLGLLTEMGGCLYVERRKRTGIGQEIQEIREALQQGLNVVLYPEGTSSNGERVLPFKKSLIGAAAGTGVPILPVVINYRKVNGEPMSHKWRDFVCWYGDQTFAPAMLRILSLKSAEVDLDFCEEIQMHSETHRREIAIHIETVIVSKFAVIQAPSDF